MPDNPSKKLDSKARQYVRSIWSDRYLGMEVPAIDWEEIREIDLAYLLQQYAFLQVVSSEPNWEETIVPQFRRATNGWIIHDYSQAMSSSPGPYLYGPGNPELKEEDQGGEEGGTAGGGSIIIETINTATAMINWAIEKGWPGVEIIEGTDFMKWAAWFHAQDLGYKLLGYEPSTEERAKRDRIIRLRAEMAAPGPTPTLG